LRLLDSLLTPESDEAITSTKTEDWRLQELAGRFLPQCFEGPNETAARPIEFRDTGMQAKERRASSQASSRSRSP